jgi:hypothetical protein
VSAAARPSAKLFARAMADGSRFDLEGLDVRLRVNPRARRISLRIDARTGEAVATAPSARRLGDAVAFARSRRDWLASRLASRLQAPRLEAGDTITVFGAAHVLRPDGRRARLAPGVLSGCGEGDVDTQLVVRAVRRAALDFFVARAEAHCVRLKTPLPTVSVADARTRWGSCTAGGPGRAGSIRLSWRLALAPFEVADYVVAHECAHLLEANHGPNFWALVHSLIGEPSPYRAFLRREGPRLHGFGRSSAAARP